MAVQMRCRQECFLRGGVGRAALRLGWGEPLSCLNHSPLLPPLPQLYPRPAVHLAPQWAMLGPGARSGWQGRGQAMLAFPCPFVPFLARTHLHFFTCVRGVLARRWTLW